MAKLIRKAQKIFGENAPLADIGIVGSLADGSPARSKDVEDIQSSGNYLNGWRDVTLGAFWPPLEDRNGLDYMITHQLAYLMQQGVPEWNAETTYYINSIVSSDGILYRSKTDDNLANSVSDESNWLKLTGLEERLNNYRNFTIYDPVVTVPEWTAFGVAEFDNTPMYLAATNGGTPSQMVSSFDGKNWGALGIATDDGEIPQGITFGNGVAVIVFSEGSIQYSSNGVTWTRNLSPFNLNLSSVVFAEGRFVAVASGAGVLPPTTTERIITSTDGASWTAVSQTATDNEFILKVVYGNGIFVAHKQNATGTTISYSSDGLTWSNGTTVIDAEDIYFTNDRFVGVKTSSPTDTLWVSDDGDVWTQEVLTITPPVGASSITNISYLNGVYAFIWDAKYMAVTTDFTNWKNVIIDNTIVGGNESILEVGVDEFVLLSTVGANRRILKSDFSGDDLRW